MTPERIRIVVSGLACTYPLGGVFWDYLQYPLGLVRLGHEVLYIEDTGQWAYHPQLGTFVEDGAANAAYFERAISALSPELANRWFYRDVTGRTYGWSPERVADFCRSADLFLHVSGSCLMRHEYYAAARVAFIDTDPMYTQATLLRDSTVEDSESVEFRRDMIRRHDVFFSFGENIGQSDCEVPTAGIDWIPTRQPVVMDCFREPGRTAAERRRVLTTVASWEPKETGPLLNGIQYYGKSVEFRRFIDLPSRSVVRMEVALSGPAPADRLSEHGWLLVDPTEVSRDPWVYRDYLANSMGEWSVAKHAYVASRSGWFSCRTACYLALGRPAIVQETGFSRFIPTGEGLLSFSTLDEAGAAIEALASRPDYHANAASEIASEYFDSDRVLAQLIENALTNTPTGVGGRS